MSESRKCDDESDKETGFAEFISIGHDIIDEIITSIENESSGSFTKQSSRSPHEIPKRKLFSGSSGRTSEHLEADDTTTNATPKFICGKVELEKVDALVDIISEDMVTDTSYEAPCSEMTPSSPNHCQQQLEVKEESLLFTEDRNRSYSPIPVHSYQRSDSGDRLRLKPFSTDNSCLDLGVFSTEGSIAGTPIEKVFPKDIFSSSSSIADHPRRRFKERFACVEFLENEITSGSSFADNGVQSSISLASRTECTGGTCHDVFDLDNVEIESTSSSCVQNSKYIMRQPLSSSTSSNPRLSLDSGHLLVSLQESSSSPALQIPESSEEMAKKHSAEEMKQPGTLRIIEILRVRIRCVRGVHVNRPIYVLAKLDNRQIHYSGALHFHDSPSCLDEFTFEVSVPFASLHIIILQGSRVTEKVPRPLGRVTLRRADVVNHSGRELSLPLQVVSKNREVTGQICIDIKRHGATFGIRVVDHCGLNVKEPHQLYLLVSRHPSKAAKKLRIGSNGQSSEWLEMSCDDTGTLELRMSLWQETLRGLSSSFHGQIRVDVDERWTSGPSKWFYLRPRHSDQFDKTKAPTNKQPLGDLKLWLSYTADHVLPIEDYSYLMTSLATSTNVGPFSASLVSLLEHLPKVDLGHVARPIVRAMIGTRELRPLLKALYVVDIQRCQDLNTLFRSHTLASKMLHELLQIYGRSYLLTTLKPVVDKIYKERRSCEVDPSRIHQGESTDKNMRALLCYFSLVFTCITESTSRCPSSLKAVLSDLRMVVREKTGRPDVELLALSSFLIMRFFAAAVLSPKTFGIKHEQPEPRVARTLVLLSKMLQRVANCCVSSHPLTSKEQWLSVVLEKIANDAHCEAMKNFFDDVSLQANDTLSQTVGKAILKEGCLIECRPGSRAPWRQLMLQKRRCVRLTDSELIWHKSREYVMPKGSLSLSDIRVISSDQNNSLIIESDNRQIVFQATGSSDAADWLSAIERQRNKLKNKTTQNHVKDLCEGDVEREMESLHVLLMEHMETLSYWQTHLDTNEPLPQQCPLIPKPLDGSMFEGEDRITHCSSLSQTIAATITATRDLEKRHEKCVAIYTKQGPGTKENPIGDNNYPLLKRSLHRE
ncbi:hypothetical protein Angca_005153 [Angiostrongylus cantonensis]|nr:hypothetical protein Angca_005153 [Angiostrongylus cantonensis]